MRELCTEADCDRPAYGRGLCSRHYQHARYHGTLPEPAQRQRICERCQQPFTGRKWNARFCSRRCMEAAQYVAVPVLAADCEGCGKRLPDERDARMRFCSRKCREDHRNAQVSATRLAEKAAAPRWCKGCGNPIPSERKIYTRYCSDACKIASRRHEAYGLTKAELGILLAQHEQCAICGAGEWGRKGPQVDHCHKTGRVRGVLCINCNNGLGRFADDPARLRAAAAYLEAAGLEVSG